MSWKGKHFEEREENRAARPTLINKQNNDKDTILQRAGREDEREREEEREKAGNRGQKKIEREDAEEGEEKVRYIGTMREKER